MAKPDELDGTQRAAILLMSLGEQDAANLLKQLDAKDVQRLGMAMAELKEVSRDQMTTVLDKFIGIVDGKADLASLQVRLPVTAATPVNAPPSRVSPVTPACRSPRPT